MTAKLLPFPGRKTAFELPPELNQWDATILAQELKESILDGIAPYDPELRRRFLGYLAALLTVEAGK